MPAQGNRVIFTMAVILTKHMQEPRLCAYSYVLAYGQEHSTGVYLYCLDYTWNKYIQCINIWGIREVFPHTCLQSTVKAFNNARLCLFVTGRKTIHSPDSQEILNVVIHKFLSLYLFATSLDFCCQLAAGEMLSQVMFPIYWSTVDTKPCWKIRLSRSARK